MFRRRSDAAGRQNYCFKSRELRKERQNCCRTATYIALAMFYQSYNLLIQRRYFQVARLSLSTHAADRKFRFSIRQRQ